ncbi:MAG: T9SS type A sorting domain-containing protein [Bacteroidia bacterium]|nr:T9SS type A sorting domain-containing protein [Bacteroidia bacterium]
MKKNKLLIFLFLILFSNSFFSQWVQTYGPAGQMVLSLAVKGNKLYAGTSNGNGLGTVYMTLDSGTTWTSMGNGLPNINISSLAVSGNKIFAGTNPGGSDPAEVYYSGDSASTWTSISTGLNISTVVEAIVIKDTFLFVGGGGLSRSTNNGATWITLLTGQHIHTLIFNGTDLFAGTHSGGVFKSSDYGANWTTANVGLPSAPVQTFCIKSGKIFAGTGYATYVSNDNGGSWASCGGSDIQEIFANDSILIRYGNYSGIQRSFNDGVTWVNINWGLYGHPVYCFNSIANNIFAGTDHNVYRSQTNLLTEISNLSEIENSSTIYPNPFSSNATIEINGKVSHENIEISIYNFVGKEIKKLNNISGRKINLDRADLSNGIYFYRLIKNDYSFASGKFIIE